MSVLLAAEKLDMGIVAGLIAIGAGLAVGIAAIATALAQRDIGSAAIGMISEDERKFGKGLIMTALPETTVIIGFAVAYLLYTNVGQVIVEFFKAASTH